MLNTTTISDYIILYHYAPLLISSHTVSMLYIHLVCQLTSAFWFDPVVRNCEVRPASVALFLCTLSLKECFIKVRHLELRWNTDLSCPRGLKMWTFHANYIEMYLIDMRAYTLHYENKSLIARLKDVQTESRSLWGAALRVRLKHGTRRQGQKRSGSVWKLSLGWDTWVGMSR